MLFFPPLFEVSGFSPIGLNAGANNNIRHRYVAPI